MDIFLRSISGILVILGMILVGFVIGEKGWFDDSYIGIDERGFSGTAFDLIESVKNKDGKCLKTAGAMDSFVEKKELAMRVTDLNVGDTAADLSLAWQRPGSKRTSHYFIFLYRPQTGQLLLKCTGGKLLVDRKCRQIRHGRISSLGV